MLRKIVLYCFAIFNFASKMVLAAPSALSYQCSRTPHKLRLRSSGFAYSSGYGCTSCSKSCAFSSKAAAFAPQKPGLQAVVTRAKPAPIKLASLAWGGASQQKAELFAVNTKYLLRKYSICAANTGVCFANTAICGANCTVSVKSTLRVLVTYWRKAELCANWRKYLRLKKEDLKEYS